MLKRCAKAQLPTRAHVPRGSPFSITTPNHTDGERRQGHERIHLVARSPFMLAWRLCLKLQEKPEYGSDVPTSGIGCVRDAAADFATQAGEAYRKVEHLFTVACSSTGNGSANVLTPSLILSPSLKWAAKAPPTIAKYRFATNLAPRRSSNGGPSRCNSPA